MIGGAEAFAVNLTEKLVAQSDYKFHVISNKITRRSNGVVFHQVPILRFPQIFNNPKLCLFR